MNMFDWIASWMHREPRATLYLLCCFILIIQTFAIYGR